MRRGSGQRALAVVAGELLGEVDDAAGAHDEVGREEDAAFRERAVGVGRAELVVGRAHDGAAAELRDRPVVEHATERVGRQEVARGGERILVRDARWRRPLHRARARARRRGPTPSPPPPRPRGAGRRVSRRGRRPVPRRGVRASARRRRGARRTARIACSTPTAVTGEGSPDPPSDTSTPVTHGVTSAMASMSAVVAPTSSAAR